MLVRIRGFYVLIFFNIRFKIIIFMGFGFIIVGAVDFFGFIAGVIFWSRGYFRYYFVVFIFLFMYLFMNF